MSESSWPISDVGLMELIELASVGQMTVETFTELAFILLPEIDAGQAVAAILYDRAQQATEHPARKSRLRSSSKTTPGQLYPLGSESLTLKWETIVDELGQ
jgi:hypothetical protein